MSDPRTTVPVEMYAVIDDAGDCGVGISAEAAREDYEARNGDLSDCEGFRTIKVIVAVPLPTVPVLKGVAPDVGDASLESVS